MMTAHCAICQHPILLSIRDEYDQVFVCPQCYNRFFIVGYYAWAGKYVHPRPRFYDDDGETRGEGTIRGVGGLKKE